MILRIPKIQLQDKTTLVPLTLAVALLLIILAIAFGASQQSKTPEVNTTTTNVTTQSGEIAVKNIVPNLPLPLTPGSPYSFTIYFKNQINLRDISFSLRTSGIYDETSNVPVTIAISQVNPSTVLLRTEEPIKQYSEYILSIIDQRTNKEIFTKGYMTKDVIATPVPSNNPSLIPVLPHETDSYILEYFADRNIYIFHFKYNLDSPKSAEEQFNDAKTEATQFIESNGVNIDSIVIEWRNS